MDRTGPSLVVSVELLQEKLETAKLHNYKNNVGDILIEIKEIYQKILDNGSTCDSMLRYTISALTLGLCPNSIPLLRE